MPSRSISAVERHAQAHLHVRGAELDLAVGDDDLDAGQGLDRAAGRCDARDGLQLVEQVVHAEVIFTTRTS